MNVNAAAISILDLDQNQKRIRIMVKIENIEELRKIKKSDYGFVIILTDTYPIIHTTNCKLIFEKDFLRNSGSRYHWFSTYSLAEKELGDISSCKLCNPD